MKLVVVKKGQRSRPGMCPWLIDFAAEDPGKK
jgi:hypothetical protein